MAKNEKADKLKKPFKYKNIEWRISRVIKSDKALVLAYIESRAVMDRLDDVFGIENWQDNYEFIENNVICHLKIKVSNEWITKTDGATQTNFESFKGGISDALKRAAVKWGIGRYLYHLSETWVDIYQQKPSVEGDRKVYYVHDKNKGAKGYWVSPDLPKWALPKDEENPPVKKTTKTNKPEPQKQPEQSKKEGGRFITDKQKEKLNNIYKSRYCLGSEKAKIKSLNEDTDRAKASKIIGEWIGDKDNEGMRKLREEYAKLFAKYKTYPSLKKMPKEMWKNMREELAELNDFDKLQIRINEMKEGL